MSSQGFNSPTEFGKLIPKILRTSPLNKPVFLFRGVAKNQQNPFNCNKYATLLKGIIYLFAFSIIISN